MTMDPLKKYLPDNTFDYVLQIIQQHHLTIKITNPRVSRLGSFRGNGKNKASTINISGALNKYSFLITLIHEIAHLKVFEAYKNRVQPHGVEWKSIFKLLMQPLLVKEVFPPDLLPVVIHHFKNPKASSSTDLKLAKALRKYDAEDGKTTPTVEDIPENSLFMWRDGRVFQKGQKQRTRYKCLEQGTNKIYLFNALAEVTPL